MVLGLGLVGGVCASPAAATATTGVLEICKTATGPGVSGTFDFTVSGHTGTITVPVGQCSAPITVTAGQVTVTEAARAGFQLASVASLPAGTLVSSDLAARAATVNVAVGDVANQTIVTFSNKAVEKGYLEVCKKAATGTTLGGSFAFTVTAAGSTYSVTAPVGGCSMPLALPAGTATVTEAVRSDAELTAIEVAPTGRLVGSPNLTTRSVTVTIVAGDIATQTIVTFTNKPVPQPKGLVKVCKAATGVPAGTTFTFTVNGVSLTVTAGSCSEPVEVSAGTAVVTEQARSGFAVAAIAVAPAGALISSDLATRTASVTVTAGKVTEVTLTNKMVTGTLKVCKAAGLSVVVGQVFHFTVAGQSVNVQAGFCSLPIVLPVGNATVDEDVPAGFRVTAISVAGAGALVSSDLAAGTAVVSIAEGVTEVTFTNAQKPAVTGCVHTKGYYKNHATVVANLLDALPGDKLLVGGVLLTAAQIDALYDRNARNYLNQVTQQLITALLNQLSGASTPTAVQTAINAAALLIDQNGGPLNGTATSSTTVVYNGVTYTASQLVDVLSAYNEGSAPGGPGDCG